MIVNSDIYGGVGGMYVIVLGGNVMLVLILLYEIGYLFGGL